MKKGRHKIIHVIAIIILVLILVRVFTLSFNGKVGQAKSSMKDVIISGICSGILESSSIIRYQTDKERVKTAFPLNMASGINNIYKNIDTGSKIPDSVHIYTKEEQSEIYTDNIKGDIDFVSYENGILTREYILTNGAILNKEYFDDYIEVNANIYRKQELPVSIMEGAIDSNEFYSNNFYVGEGGAIDTMRSYNGTPFTFAQLKDVSFLIRNFYIVDPSTRVTDELFDSEVLLGKDMTIQTENDKPQILIYHTHSQEAFLDSRKGVTEDTVVGIGDLLTEILEEKYGYNVIHDRGVYDLVDGKLDRNEAYKYARKAVLKILEENPSIEVIIDLHRDGNDKRSTIINGQETAQIMLLNGLSRNQNGPNTSIDNPNLQDNLAFSLQLQLKSLELYPGLFYKNYLQAYRYNLDLRPKSILVELGTHKNTLRSAIKAMEPFAEVLDAVLKGQ